MRFRRVALQRERTIISIRCSKRSERRAAHLVVPPTRALADPEPAPLVLLGDAILREVLGERFRQHDVTAPSFAKVSASRMCNSGELAARAYRYSYSSSARIAGREGKITESALESRFPAPPKREPLTCIACRVVDRLFVLFNVALLLLEVDSHGRSFLFAHFAGVGDTARRESGDVWVQSQHQRERGGLVF